MVCKKCGKEIRDDALFCPYCGKKIKKQLNQDIIQIKFYDKLKYDNLKKIINKRVIVGIISVSLIIVLSLTGYYGYNFYMSNKNFLSNVAEGDKNYKLNKFNVARNYYEMALKNKSDSRISEKIKLCDELEQSLKYYNDGISDYKSKNYLLAYKSFKKVSSQDIKRYKDSKIKAKESLKLYENDDLNAAKLLAEQGEYSEAIDKMNEILNVDETNENVKNLKNEYQTSLDKKENDEKVAQQEKEEEIVINTAKNAIKITSIYSSQPNSANGVDLHIIWTNVSSKTIKYISFEVIPYNAVGDPQHCEIKGTSNFKGKVTGPIASGVTYGDDKLWEDAWYNNSITSVKLVSVDITYMDDTTLTIDKDHVKYIQ